MCIPRADVRYLALGTIPVRYRGGVQRISYTFCRKFLVHWCHVLAAAAGCYSAGRADVSNGVSHAHWLLMARTMQIAPPYFQTEGGMIMKARMIVFAIGIAIVVLGCASNEVGGDRFSRARGASYTPVSATDSGWYYPGAITVDPGQLFEN